MKAKNQNYWVISILVLLALISPISYAGDITAESGKAVDYGRFINKKWQRKN